MRIFRRVLGDRLSGGVIAALTAYALLLQGLLSAYAAGAAAAQVRAGPALVICSSIGAVEIGPERPGGPAEKSPAHACCIGFCSAGCALKVAFRTDRHVSAPAKAAGIDAPWDVASLCTRSADAAHQSEARAPPPSV